METSSKMATSLFSNWILPVCIFPLFLLAGCESVEPGKTLPADISISKTDAYAPAGIHIIPLTKFIHTDPQHYPQLKVYIELTDSFGSNMKGPAVFRFELYEYAPRSGEPKGKRVFIWQDVVLQDAEINNGYWRDFLRCYEFVLDLDFEPKKGGKFILLANCFSETGKRLTYEFITEYK